MPARAHRYVSRRRVLGATAATALSAAAGATFAQLASSKTLRIILTAPPGSSIDVLGRVIADKLRERSGQAVVVENRPAAGGTVGTHEISRATPTVRRLGCHSPARWRLRRFCIRSCRMTRSKTWHRSCSSAPRRTCWQFRAHCRSIRSKSFCLRPATPRAAELRVGRQRQRVTLVDGIAEDRSRFISGSYSIQRRTARRAGNRRG